MAWCCKHDYNYVINIDVGSQVYKVVCFRYQLTADACTSWLLSNAVFSLWEMWFDTLLLELRNQILAVVLITYYDTAKINQLLAGIVCHW